MRRIAVLLLSAALLLSCVSCGQEEKVQEGKRYLIYGLADPEQARGSDVITSVRVELNLPDQAETEEVAEAVLRRLMEGAEGCESPLDPEIELREVTVKGRRAYVDFSPRYASLSGIDLSIADYCITLSLTELEEISSVYITAGGKELFYRENEALMGRDVRLSSMGDVIETVPVTLYFANAGGELAPEDRQLDLYEGQTLAETLIAALIEGPWDRELSPLLPSDFTVKGIRVEKGICYVNLSRDALNTLPEDRKRQEKILLSIGQSIYSMDNVDEICLFADGKEINTFGSVPVDLVRFPPEDKD